MRGVVLSTILRFNITCKQVFFGIMPAANEKAQISAIVRGIGGLTERAIRKITLDLHANLVEDTPVDTGWAQANWVPRVGRAYTGGGGRPGNVSAAAAASASGQAQVLGYRLGQGKVFVTNNVIYIEPLNGGTLAASSGRICSAGHPQGCHAGLEARGMTTMAQARDVLNDKVLRLLDANNLGNSLSCYAALVSAQASLGLTDADLLNIAVSQAEPGITDTQFPFWIRVATLQVGRDQVSLGKVGRRKYTITGSFIVQIFVLVNVPKTYAEELGKLLYDETGCIAVAIATASHYGRGLHGT